MPIFTIDGNIGCGKSSVLEYLHTHYHYPIDLEPVVRWAPFLSEMYRRNQGAFNFQVRIWLDRCWIQEKTTSHILMERSPYFQANVFVALNRELGRITPEEHGILAEMYEKAFSMWSPQGMIYLRSRPEACGVRIRQRARLAEDRISPDYLRRLHELHEYAYYYGIRQGVPIICIDVEGKTIPQISGEIHAALGVLGALPALPEVPPAPGA